MYRQSFGKLSYELWELTAGTPFRSYGSSVRMNPAVSRARAGAFSRDGRLLAGTDARRIRMFDLFTGRELGAGEIPPALGLAFDNDLNLWACGDGGLLLLPCRRDDGGRHLTYGPPEPVGPREAMERLRVSADGSTMGVVAKGRIRVFDLRARREIFATPPNQPKSYLSLSPDGKSLAAASWGGREVEVWDVPTGRLQTRLRAGDDFTVSADSAFSPDGRWLATVGMGGCVLWATDSWERRWTRPRADLPFVAFSPDGAYVIHRDRKSFLELLATATGERLGQIEAPRLEHLDGAGAAFSPDGGFFAAHPMSTSELFVWNLVEVRHALARLGLDWKLPSLPDPGPSRLPTRSVGFAVEPGDSSGSSSRQ